MWPKKVIILGVILGLFLGVFSFWFLGPPRHMGTPRTQPRRDPAQRAQKGLESKRRSVMESEPDEPQPSTPTEIAARPQGQGIDRPQATDLPSEEQKTSEPSQPLTKPSESRETGTLSVNAQPWAEVSVDGKSRGETPLELELSVGRHKVVLVYENQEVTQTVTIKAGRVEHLTHAW